MCMGTHHEHKLYPEKKPKQYKHGHNRLVKQFKKKWKANPDECYVIEKIQIVKTFLGSNDGVHIEGWLKPD